MNKLKFTAQPNKFISYYQLAINTAFKESDIDDARGIQFDDEGNWFSTENKKLERAMVEYSKLPNNVELEGEIDE